MNGLAALNILKITIKAMKTTIDSIGVEAVGAWDILMVAIPDKATIKNEFESTEVFS